MKMTKPVQVPQVNIKKLTNTAKTPTKGSAAAAGFDLYVDSDEVTIIAPHETLFLGTGIAIEVPMGYFGAIFARSGIAAKRGLRPANCVGVIDADYRGEIIVALHNDSDNQRFVEPYERIAQLSILPYYCCDLVEVTELSDTIRGADGFGSTGTE